jgi:hypothetical protein
MPYTTHWEDRGIRWVFTGVLTNEELLNANLDIYDDPRFMEMRYQVVDFLQVTNFNVTPEVVREIGILDEKASQRNPDVKVAVIATNLFHKGLTRMWELSGGAGLSGKRPFSRMRKPHGCG